MPADLIRPVYFTPRAEESKALEITTLQRMRRRGGPAEFLTPQRLDFDVLMRIDSGFATHMIDFADHHLVPGDMLWIRAGQIHRWGAISDIEGQVVLFAPHAIDTRTLELIMNMSSASHWRANVLRNSPVDAAWTLLLRSGRQDADAPQTELRASALEHALAALLLQLVIAQPIGIPTGPAHSHEVYLWFRDEINRRFDSWHQVALYAARLGYSARTLNRLARSHTGLTAKQLIDERVVLEARRLLSHSDAPIADVAAQLGFDDPSNFSSYFQRRTGSTPGEFRNGQP
ncbi:MAG: helix-turn-helix transcriptional regulator [Aeromicrobium sp.]